MSLGVVYRPDFPADRLAEFAAGAKLDEIWFWEDCFQRGGIAQAAVALAASELTVGIGLIPAPLRNVTMTAMEIAALAEMFPGRVKVAIGHGVQTWMRQAGAAVDSPMTLLREYVTALRALLMGESVTRTGRYVRLTDVRLTDVRLDVTARVPVLIGGRGPKTLRLAGEIADGVLFDSKYAVTGLAGDLQLVADGRTDRDAALDFNTTLFVACAPGADGPERLARQAAKWDIPPGEPFGAGGTPEQIAARVREYHAAGVDTVVLHSLGPEDPDVFLAACTVG